MNRYFVIHKDEDILEKESIEDALSAIKLRLYDDPVLSNYHIIKGELIPIEMKVIVNPIYEQFLNSENAIERRE